MKKGKKRKKTNSKRKENVLRDSQYLAERANCVAHTPHLLARLFDRTHTHDF